MFARFLPAAANATAVMPMGLCMSMCMSMCMPPRVREDGGLAT
jgi:hypothetical protein